MNSSRLLVLAVITAVVSANVSYAQLEKALPKDTDMVLTINVRRALESAVMKDALPAMRKALEENEQVAALLKGLNLDPLKDIDRITVSMTGLPMAKPGIVLINGKFDPAKIETAAQVAAAREKDRLAVLKEGGMTMYKISMEDGETLYGVVDRTHGIVMASSKGELNGLLERLSGSKPASLSTEFKALLAKADPKASMSLMMLTKDKTNSVPLPDPQMAKTLEKIQDMSIEVTLTADIALTISMGTANAEDTKEISAMMAQALVQAKQLAPVITIQQPQLKPLVKVIEDLKTETKGNTVQVRAVLPGPVIKELMKLANPEN